MGRLWRNLFLANFAALKSPAPTLQAQGRYLYLGLLPAALLFTGPSFMPAAS